MEWMRSQPAVVATWYAGSLPLFACQREIRSATVMGLPSSQVAAGLYRKLTVCGWVAVTWELSMYVGSGSMPWAVNSAPSPIGPRSRSSSATAPAT